MIEALLTSLFGTSGFLIRFLPSGSRYMSNTFWGGLNYIKHKKDRCPTSELDAGSLSRVVLTVVG